MTKEEAKLVLDNARPQTKEIDRQFYDDEDLNNALDMAIEALEQSSDVEDLIKEVSEQEMWLSDAGYNAYNVDIAFKSIIRAIQNISLVIPTRRWIPVSERLPEPNRLVLCYITTGATETYFLALWNDVQKAWEEGIGGYRLLKRDLGYEVIAWQPLPKPYEEKRGNKNDI